MKIRLCKDIYEFDEGCLDCLFYKCEHCESIHIIVYADYYPQFCSNCGIEIEWYERIR